MSERNPAKLLIGMTGSVSMLGMPAYLIALKQRFPNMKVMMTESARHFVSQEALSLIVNPIYVDMFPLSSLPADHIHLSQWADLFAVIPATAHILGQAAHGLAGSLLSLTILSHRKPILFFPNMNDVMWESPAVQRNVQILKEYGHEFVDATQVEGYEITSQRTISERFMPMPPQVIEILENKIEERQVLKKRALAK